MFKLIISILTLLVLAANTSDAKGEKIKDSSIESLIMGINSDNLGLKTSSAYMLGELKCSKAVIPLLKMLKNEEREDVRIVAALALQKIGDARGIFAIKQAIRFDSSERVRRLCTNFYHSYITHLDDSISVALK